MRYSVAFSSAIEALFNSKLRSLLAALGVIIGVAAVSTLISFGQGFRVFATAQLAEGEAGTLVLLAQSPTGGTAAKLNDADIAALARLSGITRITPELTGYGDLSSGALNTQVEAVGVYTEHLAKPTELVLGRWITSIDEQNRARVAVVSLALAQQLFPDGHVIGQTIRFGGMPLQIIGVRQPGKASVFAHEVRLFVPMSTARERLFSASGTAKVSQATLMLSDPLQVEAYTASVRQTLRTRYKLQPSQADNFTLHDFRAQAEINDTLLQGLTLLLGSIGSIALLVGGIGIMNIMLVSVQERTQEIGLRKAVGARRSDILLQFLLESTALSVVGGAFGIFVSLLIIRIGAVVLAAFFAQYDLARALQLDPLATLLGLTFATLVGILAGSYPAHQASRLSPITALRATG
jgi:putative ABC transport system permease protein